jgi:hypothetical protein
MVETKKAHAEMERHLMTAQALVVGLPKVFGEIGAFTNTIQHTIRKASRYFHPNAHRKPEEVDRLVRSFNLVHQRKGDANDCYIDVQGLKTWLEEKDERKSTLKTKMESFIEEQRRQATSGNPDDTNARCDPDQQVGGGQTVDTLGPSARTDNQRGRDEERLLLTEAGEESLAQQVDDGQTVDTLGPSARTDNQRGRDEERLLLTEAGEESLAQQVDDSHNIGTLVPHAVTEEQTAEQGRVVEPTEEVPTEIPAEKFTDDPKQISSFSNKCVVMATKKEKKKKEKKSKKRKRKDDDAKQRKRLRKQRQQKFLAGIETFKEPPSTFKPPPMKQVIETYQKVVDSYLTRVYPDLYPSGFQVTATTKITRLPDCRGPTELYRGAPSKMWRRFQAQEGFTVEEAYNNMYKKDRRFCYWIVLKEKRIHREKNDFGVSNRIDKEYEVEPASCRNPNGGLRFVN